jgi:tetratricopeptide (TPR) repeat protein
MVKRRGLRTRRPRSVESKLWVPCLSLGLLAGCVVNPVEIDDIVDRHNFYHNEVNLTEAQLARNLDEIDEQFSEPRTGAKVMLSLETAEASISRANDYEAVWRGARACYWLSMNHPDIDQRERYALRGYSMARFAARYMSSRVEPYYYAALNTGAFCSLKHERGYIPNSKWLDKAKYYGEMAGGIAPSFDYGGPHRFLGKLIVETSGTMTHELGRFEEGLEHLKKAVTLGPEYAENHLYLAEAYLENDDYGSARAEIDAVLGSSIPPDRSVEHTEWLDAATDLLAQLPADSSGSSETPATVDVSGFEKRAEE